MRALVLLLCTVAVLPVRAAESTDTCRGFIDALPATLTTQGVWCLRANLATTLASGAAITVATNNVTIDCNDYRIDGSGAGSVTQARGIATPGPQPPAPIAGQNLTVRHCDVRGFQVGVELIEAHGALVEDNRFAGNTAIAIRADGDGSVVRGNRVLDTGIVDDEGIATGIHTSGDADVLDNFVEGVDGERANGILADSSDSVVAGNRVSHLHASEHSTGIQAAGGRTVVAGNSVFGPAEVGISCADDGGTSRGNTVLAAATAIQDCLSVSDFTP